MPIKSFAKHVRVIHTMLHRKFATCIFKVSLQKEHTKRDGCRMWRRWIKIECTLPNDHSVHLKDIEYYLQRFQNSEPDRKGRYYTRSYWVNERGFARAGTIRRINGDGTSEIMERETKPSTGGPYQLMRFEIQEYEVTDVAKVVKPYDVYEDDDFDEEA